MQKKAFLAGTAKLRKELTAKLETPTYGKQAKIELEELNKAVNGQTKPYTNNLWS